MVSHYIPNSHPGLVCGSVHKMPNNITVTVIKIDLDNAETTVNTNTLPKPPEEPDKPPAEPSDEEAYFGTGTYKLYNHRHSSLAMNPSVPPRINSQLGVVRPTPLPAPDHFQVFIHCDFMYGS